MNQTPEYIESADSQETRSNDFVNIFPGGVFGELMLLSVWSSYQRKVVVFQEKDQARAIYLVGDGEVKLSINSSDGRRLIPRIARKGEILGLASVLTGGACEMTGETVHHAKLGMIGRTQFCEFLARHPGAYRILNDFLIRDFAAVCEQLRIVVLSPSTTKKLARLFLQWSEYGLAEGQGVKIRFSMTHEEIGEFIGASRETVTRILSKFKNQQLVVFQGATLTIPSKTALAKYAEAYE